MRITKRIIREIIKEELASLYLTEQPKEGLFDTEAAEETDDKKDVDYSLEDTGVKVPTVLQKAMDPKNPMDFAKKDEMIDSGENPKFQAAMLAKFALDYTDGDEAKAQKILKMGSTQGLKTLMKGVDEEGETEKKNEGISADRMQQIIKEEIARYLLTK